MPAAGPPARPAGAHTWTLDTTPPSPRSAPRARPAGLPSSSGGSTSRAPPRPASPPRPCSNWCAGAARPCVGGQLGWMFSDGAEQRRLLDAVAESCRWARALGAPVAMSPADLGTGDLGHAAAGVRELGDRAAEAGVRLALEPPSQAAQLNSVERVRELLARADHPACGLLLDAYHLHRGRWPPCGRGPRSERDRVRPVQRRARVRARAGSGPRPATARPGHRPVPRILPAARRQGLRGALLLRGAEPAAWARDPETVAREALAATQAVLS